jgi:hypothetical protein
MGDEYTSGRLSTVRIVATNICVRTGEKINSCRNLARKTTVIRRLGRRMRE